MKRPAGQARINTLLTRAEQRDFTGYAYISFHVIAILIGVTASAWSLYLNAPYHFVIGFFFSFGLVASLLLWYYIGDNASRMFALAVVPAGVMALQVAGVLFSLTEFEFRIFPAAFALVCITLAGFSGRNWKVFVWISLVAGLSIATLEWYFFRQGQSTTVEGLLMLALFGFTTFAAYEFMITRKQLVRSREQAEEASRLKSRFISNMSHEIRTPLAGIVGLSNLITMTETDAERSRLIKQLQETTETLRQQVDEMLDFQYLETAKAEPAFRDRVVIPDFLEQCLEPYRKQAESSGLTFEFRPADEAAKAVLLDKHRVCTAVQDVVGNAVKFTLSGSIRVTVSRLSVSSSAENTSWLEISVSDTGVGMNEAVREQALQPFVQGDDSYSKRFPGKGLGLARASLALRQAGGTLDIVSNPGSGTTVDIGLPVSVEQE